MEGSERDGAGPRALVGAAIGKVSIAFGLALKQCLREALFRCRKGAHSFFGGA